MAEQRENKRCSACGGEAVHIQDMSFKDDRLLGCDWLDAALYRCTVCGHFDFYEREEDREYREREEARRQEHAAMPDFRCPQCGQVSKRKLCGNCNLPCIPVTSAQPREESPAQRPEKPKKRRWFGRDQDKSDWEG